MNIRAPTPDPLARQLELARRAYTPSPESRERVLDKLVHAPVAPGTPLEALPGAVPRSPKAALRTTALQALVAAGLVSLGVAGGWQAHGVYDEPPPLPHAPPVAADDPSTRAELIAPEVVAPERLAPPAREADGALAAADADERRASPTQGDASRGIHARGERAQHSRALDTVSSSSPAQPGSRAAIEELALLQRAERAVRAGNAALGLPLIAELDAGYPRSKLIEERRAIELMAHCAAGATDGASRAERFLRAQPRSIYAARKSELCRAATSQQ